MRRFAGDDVRQVVVVGEGVAPRRTSRRERAGDSVPVTRVTVIDASGLGDPHGWLIGAGVTDQAVSALMDLMSSYRVAAADPFVADADVRRALRVRVGYGSGDQVAAGEWSEARELPVPEIVTHGRRRARNRPVERLAALLAGRDAVLACEELALRARLDLSCGRDREAALQLEVALSAALAELAGWVGFGDLAARVAQLAALRGGVIEAAAAAREGRLDALGVEAVSTALERLEAALRARAIYAAEGE